MTESSASESIPAPASSPPASERSPQRYEPQRLLGEGAMGAVYLVYDREAGEQLALKKLFRVDGRSVLRLKREFRALADMSHPNLVRVYELGRAADGWFLTMEFVDGEDLTSYLARGNSVTLSRESLTGEHLAAWRSWLTESLLPTFCQLAAGVAALHRAGMLHRDLKPSNVMVSNGRVIVLDFGLVRELDPNAATLTEDGAVTGTPAYMPPEQALGKALDESSDWYAFGAMLYEALTGELPFDGSMYELLRQKLELNPLPPHELNPEIPEELSALCAALLARDPGARPSGDQVLAYFEKAAPDADIVTEETTQQTDRQSPTELPFFGREAEIAALWTAMQDAQSGHGVVVHVRALSGAGKSALVEEFLGQLEESDSPLQQPGALVLRSRCYEREAMPFKALDGLIDALGRHLARLDDLEVSHLLPTDVAALAQLFPVLDRLRAVRRLMSTRTNASSVQSRQRAEAALRELLRRVAARQPIVLWIDDLQWGDLDSAGILKSWLQHASDLPVLFLFSYRADEVATSPCLRALLGDAPADAAHAPRVLDLAALSSEDIRALCRHRLGARAQIYDALIARIVREADGSPFLAAQLATLAANKLAQGKADVDAISLTDLVDETKSLLPANALVLLCVLAVAGRPITPKLALRAAGIRQAGRSLVHTLRSLQLVRTREIAGERLLEVYHDRVREGVLRQLTASESQQLHAGLLTVLERSGRDDPDWLLTHALGAGERVAAFRYGLAAAERAMATLAFERAAELYARCVELSDASAEQRCELLQKLAFALDCCGRGSRAADAYFEAAALAGKQDALRLTRLCMSHLFRCGRFDEGETMLQRLLAAMGVRVPKGTGGLILAIVWERLRVAVRGMRYVTRDASEVPAALLARFDTFDGLRFETAAVNALRSALFQAWSVRYALAAGEPMRILQALGGICYMEAMSGSPRAERRVERLHAQARALAETIATPAARAAVYAHEALASFMLGRFENVIAASYEAERLYREHATSQLLGSYYIRAAVVSARIGALFVTSDLRAFIRELSAALEEARATEDVAAQLHFALNETILDQLLDRSEASIARLERQRTQLPKGDFGAVHLLHMASVCLSAYATGRYAWGVRLLEEDWPRFQRSAVRHTRSLAWLGRMYRARLLVSQHFSQNSHSGRARTEIDAFARLRMTTRADGHVEILRGRLLYSEGKREQGIALLRRATEVMPQRDEAERARCALGCMIGGPDGAALRDLSLQNLSEMGVVNPAAYCAAAFPELNADS